MNTAFNLSRNRSLGFLEPIPYAHGMTILERYLGIKLAQRNYKVQFSDGILKSTQSRTLSRSSVFRVVTQK